MCDVQWGTQHVMNVQNILWWQKMFKVGRTSTYDMEWEGWTLSKINETKWCVRVRLDDDHCLTVTNLHWEMVVYFLREVGCGIVRCASNKLEMHKVCAQWVPHELIPEIWEQVVAMQTFLAHYEKGGTKLLEWAVTGDESWIHYWTSKMKACSSVWKTKNKPSLRKFMDCFAGKVMLMAFWDG